MRYLVTGGAGFIGSNTVDELVRRGHSVTILDDLSTGRESNFDAVRARIEFIRGTITDLSILQRACAGVIAGASDRNAECGHSHRYTPRL